MNNQHKICFRADRWIALMLLLLSGIWLTSCEDLLSDLDSGDPRDKLVDKWKCDETAGSIKSSMEIYWVEISKHPYDSNRVLIHNFYNVDANAEAILKDNSLNLPLQTIDGGYQISGSGQIQGSKANEIIWTYTVDDRSGEANRVNAIFSRLTF